MMWLAPGISGGYEDAWKALSTYGGLLAVSGLACTPAIEKLYDYGKDKILMKILLAAVFWYCVWRLILEGNNPFMYFSFRVTIQSIRISKTATSCLHISSSFMIRKVARIESPPHV